MSGEPYQERFNQNGDLDRLINLTLWPDHRNGEGRPGIRSNDEATVFARRHTRQPSRNGNVSVSERRAIRRKDLSSQTRNIGREQNAQGCRGGENDSHQTEREAITGDAFYVACFPVPESIDPVPEQRLRDHQGMDGISTPDDRYIVVRGRLWRKFNPHLNAAERTEFTAALMKARRAVKSALAKNDARGLKAARRAVDRAKVRLGERGPLWWDDGEPDYNRRMVANTPYSDWFERASVWEAAILTMVEARAPDATACPSEVARSVERSHWRRYLEEVRHVARHLARREQIVITQGDRMLDPDQPFRGPIRLASKPVKGRPAKGHRGRR